MRIRFSIVLLTVLTAMLVLPASAQDATPTAATPDPALCTLNPLTPDDLQRIAGTVSTPVPTSTPITGNMVLPDATELFTSEREEVEKDIRRAIACVNTGEPLKALAAYTDAWIGSFLISQGGLDEDLIAGLQVDQPHPHGVVLEHDLSADRPELQLALSARIGRASICHDRFSADYRAIMHESATLATAPIPPRRSG